MARVKPRRPQQEAPSRHAGASQGVLRQQEPVVPGRQRAGHALAAVRVPRSPGPQGRDAASLDPAHQRRLSPVHGTTYSRFIAGLKAADVEVDRKILADLAVQDDDAFAALVEVAASANSAAQD